MTANRLLADPPPLLRLVEHVEYSARAAKRRNVLHAPDTPVSREIVARLYWRVSRMGYDDVLHCQRYMLTYVYPAKGYPFYCLTQQGSDIEAVAEVRDEGKLNVLCMAIAHKLARLGWRNEAVTVGQWEAANVPTQPALFAGIESDVCLYVRRRRKVQLVDI